MSVELLPDFPGTQKEEEHDPLLTKVAAGHRGPLNRNQLQLRPPGAPRVRELGEDEPHLGDLFHVDNAHWNHADPEKRDEIRKQILKQMWGDHTGYPEEFYATRDTFAWDAAVCYNRHNRPDAGLGCPDYESDDKRLTDPSWVQRGAEQGISRRHIFLCAWCPYQSVVTTKKRMARGDYDT